MYPTKTQKKDWTEMKAENARIIKAKQEQEKLKLYAAKYNGKSVFVSIPESEEHD